ncbi:MAG: paraquat-inducible protein A [Magnetococcales bacterium]|nr:paraquat-inducible protein A [Magnetococcales bacterium]
MECRHTPRAESVTGSIQDSWTLCHDCHAPSRLPPLPPGGVARCPRCGAELARRGTSSPDAPLALALAGLILYLMANAQPLLILRLGGRQLGNTLLAGVLAMTREGMWDLALLVFLTSMLFPALMLLGLIHTLLPLKLGHQPRQGIRVFKMVLAVTPWSMVGIYTLGLFVAYVKLTSMASVMPGMALYAFFGLLLVTSAARATLNPAQVWERLAPATPPPPSDDPCQRDRTLCHVCALPARLPETKNSHPPRCLRCHSRLHPRKAASLTRTWALLWTATFLYIPANLYPVMTVIKMGRGEPDTILSGVKHLIESGMWPLALLVFMASIVVPVMKIVILMFLLISVKRGSVLRCRDRTTLYRVLETFGHWSMVDIFLVSILTALVDFGSLALIKPGIGASFFAAVVVLTLFAARAFDPRLIWDPLNEKQHES